MFPFKLKFLALPLAWFLTLMILDGTDEKIVGNSNDLFLVYIQKFLPTLAWICRIFMKKKSWLVLTIFLCLASKIIDVD